MIEKVHKYIRELGLIVPGDRVSVAVSGGADSVALLHVLLELRQELGAVLTVSHFEPSGRHGVEDTAILRLQVHGSREKGNPGPVVPDIEAPRR